MFGWMILLALMVYLYDEVSRAERKQEQAEKAWRDCPDDPYDDGDDCHAAFWDKEEREGRL